MLKELGAQVSESTRKAVEEKVEALKKALASDDISQLRKAMEGLNAEAQKIGAEMYQKGQGAAAPPPSEDDSGSSDEPGVVDADFEDVDKK